MTDTTTPTVEIPDDVFGNSRNVLHIGWFSARQASQAEIDSARKFADTFRYTVIEWDDVDKDGTRVTLTRISRWDGKHVDLFATYYFTRVTCTDCEYRYAQVYLAVTDADGVTHPAAPFCGTHADVVRKITARQPGYSLAESEPLIIGQH